MFDTVRFRVDAPLRSGASLMSLKPVIRAFGDQHFGLLTSFECSLPRLLFRHNGKLVANQAELDEALALLWQKLDGIAVLPPLESWIPRRLDLVWHFGDLHADRVINAISAFRYPGIQKSPMHQVDHGVTWIGAGSRLMVKAYNKCAQMRISGDVLRIEVKLSGDALRRLRGGDWRNFEEMWQVYRGLVAKLPELPKIEGLGGLPEAIGRIAPHALHEQILSNTKGCSRTKRGMRARMRVAAANLPKKLDWNELLPEMHPGSPPVVIGRRTPTMPQNRATLAAYAF